MRVLKRVEEEIIRDALVAYKSHLVLSLATASNESFVKDTVYEIANTNELLRKMKQDRLQIED